MIRIHMENGLTKQMGDGLTSEQKDRLYELVMFLTPKTEEQESIIGEIKDILEAEKPMKHIHKFKELKNDSWWLKCKCGEMTTQMGLMLEVMD